QYGEGEPLERGRGGQEPGPAGRGHPRSVPLRRRERQAAGGRGGVRKAFPGAEGTRTWRSRCSSMTAPSRTRCALSCGPPAVGNVEDVNGAADLANQVFSLNQYQW